MNNLLTLHKDIDTKDMDAWNEECYYAHKQTEMGGRYPSDFTGGFGPEEFMLKEADDGKYVIKTNNFANHRQNLAGETTLYLDLYTNYSRPNQKHERLLIRTEDVKKKDYIGEIIWN